ncbi:hypothetical protein MBH78_14175 [Oceanimonas sp. NS1]|nr:hypothetical protein [Oceanimonas sp. NS1]
MADLHLVDRIVGFLRDLGLPVHEGEVIAGFLPGIAIRGGGLVVDTARLSHPGDLLHEAGHLAVIAPAQRLQADGDVSSDGGEEMAAIAWSYAAAESLSLPLEVLFHEQGYRGQAAWLREHFRESRQGRLGVPLLVYFGMTDSPDQERDTGFPAMCHWLRPA